MTCPVRVQRAPDEGLVYLHFGDADHRSFPLLENDHIQARDFFEGTDLAQLLGTSATSIPGRGVSVRLPKED